MFKKFKEGTYPRSTSRPSTAKILRRSQTQIPTKQIAAGIISAWGARPALTKRKSSIHIAPHQGVKSKKPQVLLQQASGVWAEIQLFQFHQGLRKGASTTQRKYSDNTGFYFPNPKQECAYNSEPYGALSQRSPLLPSNPSSKSSTNNAKIAPFCSLHFSSRVQQVQSRKQLAYPKNQYGALGDQSPMSGTTSEVLPQISYRTGITRLNSSKSPEKKKLKSCSAKQLGPSIGPKTPVRLGSCKRVHFKRRQALQNSPIALFCFTGVVGDVFKAKIFSEQTKKLYLRPGLRQGLNLLRGYFQVVLYLNPPITRNQKSALVSMLRAQNLMNLFDGVYLREEEGKGDIEDCLKHVAYDFEVQDKYERMIIVDSIDQETEDLKNAEQEELLSNFKTKSPTISADKNHKSPRFVVLQNPRMHSNYSGATIVSICFFLLKYSGAKDTPLQRFVQKNKLHHINSALVYYDTQSSPVKDQNQSGSVKQPNSASKASRAIRRVKSEHEVDLSQLDVLLPEAERLNLCRCLEGKTHSTQEVLCLITDYAMNAYRSRLAHELKGRQSLSPKGKEVKEISQLLSSHNQLTHSMATMLQKNFQILKNRHALSSPTLSAPSSPISSGSVNQKLMSQISSYIKHSSQPINPRQIYEKCVKGIFGSESQEVILILPGALRSGKYESVGSIEVDENSVNLFELMSGVSSRAGRVNLQ